MDIPEESTVRQLFQEDARLKWVLHSNHDVKCFTEDEVKGITNNYQTVLGRGAFGEVYQGVLGDTSMVAVKRFIHNVKQDFAKELSVHREINHKNVVRLIGYCVDENALMMITEYISKGNLSDALHRDNIPIPLDRRLGIAIECAEALHYMHSQMYTRVIHGDIKPANILLDGMLRAKISDFGISRPVNTDNTLYTLNVIGSIGYMDPLFALNGRLTEKSDVYSFGVVLLELITRKRARTDGEDMSFVECFTQALAKGIKRVREMFDSEIATSSDMKTIEEIAKLVGRCLSLELCKRPAMLEVAERLRRLREALGQGKLAMFIWGERRNKSVPVETHLHESSTSDSEGVGLVGPTNAEESQNTNKTEGIVFVDSTKPTVFQLEAKYLSEASTQFLGRGIAWTTRKAKLLNGTELVYKSLKGVQLQEEEFVQRVSAIGAIKHEHVAPLRGYYYSDEWKVLVYYHMPIGSLEKMLHGGNPEPDSVGLLEVERDTGGLTSSVRAPLDWKQRSAISLAVARGVAFIHSAGPSSVHGNIKSSNILLTGTHNAVVSEHGLMTLVDPRGISYGNRAPEHFFSIPQVSQDQEDDVYSFGILLLELLTRKPKMAWQGSSALAEVRDIVRDGGMSMILAKKVLGWGHTRVEEKGILQLLQVAMNCCDIDPPEMSEIVQAIEMIPQQS